jgi:hypothetical protein
MRAKHVWLKQCTSFNQFSFTSDNVNTTQFVIPAAETYIHFVLSTNTTSLIFKHIENLAFIFENIFHKRQFVNPQYNKDVEYHCSNVSVNESVKSSKGKTNRICFLKWDYWLNVNAVWTKSFLYTEYTELPAEFIFYCLWRCSRPHLEIKSNYLVALTYTTPSRISKFNETFYSIIDNTTLHYYGTNVYYTLKYSTKTLTAKNHECYM